jgi:ABC-type multidrug transport system fused ATPase/permease subunit
MLAMSSTGQHVLADLRAKVMAHIHSLSLQYLERKEAGDLMSRVMNDVDVINSFISQGFAQLIGNLFSLTGIVIMMFLLEWRMAMQSYLLYPL